MAYAKSLKPTLLLCFLTVPIEYALKAQSAHPKISYNLPNTAFTKLRIKDKLFQIKGIIPSIQEKPQLLLCNPMALGIFQNSFQVII